MIRGTNPKVTLTVDGADFTKLKNLYVTFAQGPTVITKRNNDVEVNGNVITIPFTQKETLNFKVGTVKVQIRYTDIDGNANATSTTAFTVSDVIMDGVIE